MLKGVESGRSALASLRFQPSHVLLALLGHLQEDAPRPFICGRVCQSAALGDPSRHTLYWVRVRQPSRLFCLSMGERGSFELAMS